MRLLRLLAVPAFLATTAFVSSGPAWISIEYPANPFDSGSKGAFLLVHAFHHAQSVAFPVSGSAEGLVDGARRTISLSFNATSRPGVYALQKQWPDNGIWTLVLSVTQGDGEGNVAQAMVELGPRGEVAQVSVPTRQRNGWTIPIGVSMADVESGLRARAARLASR